MRSRRAAVVLAALGVSIAAPAAHAAETVTVERQPFTASGYKNVFAWSSYAPETQSYVLRLEVNGQKITANADPRPVAFDVNVGPLPGGRGVGVVYTRCSLERPDFAARRGCDLFLYDVGEGRERRLRSSSPSVDERTPALHGSFISFARTYPATRGRGTRDVVYKARTDGRGRSMRLPTPGSAAGSVGAMDIGSNGLVAYTWTSPRAEFSTSTLYRVVTGDKRLQRVYQARSGGANAARTLSPTVSGTRLYWARTNNGSGTGNRILRFNVSTRRYEEAQGSPEYLSVSFLGAEGFLIARAGGGDTCVGNIMDQNDLSKSECILERLTTNQVRFRRATSPLGLD